MIIFSFHAFVVLDYFHLYFVMIFYWITIQVSVLLAGAMKKRKLRYLALNIQNKVNKPVSLKFEMQGREARFFIPALSKDRRLLKTYGDYAVPFTAKSIGDGRELYMNKMERLLLTPTDNIQWRKIVIKSGM